ncbi:MAG TPA: LysR substrate-binding domain-containing protein [Anaeromyxobacteraceae bacterium]|jgi:DNA-binding transcriptional LysR family regulator|nr:LysR substrate-binding domain-containing protein [Anaeromyxobacteraceae bacterium]
MLEWDDLRFFLAVHRRGSHAAAARALGVAPTTIGRRLAALEEAAGARLFLRTPEGLAPTAAARALLPRAERVEAEVLDAERELGGADARPTGTVRLTCGDGFAAAVLAPAAPAFLAAHPGLDLDVRADVRALDLARGEADLAVRLFRPRERSLVGRRLGTEHYALYASPQYLARRGAPRSARDLAGHDLVLYVRDFDRMPTQVWVRRLAPSARVVFRGSTTTSIEAACGAGAGVALLTTSTVRRDPRFVPVLPRLVPPANEIWAVTHPDLRGSARIVAVMRWLEGLVRAVEGPA